MEATEPSKPEIVFRKAPLKEVNDDEGYGSDEFTNVKIAKRRLCDDKELARQDLKGRYGKGFAMLQKLGWNAQDTASLGLGKQRNGIINPVLVRPSLYIHCIWNQVYLH